VSIVQLIESLHIILFLVHVSINIKYSLFIFQRIVGRGFPSKKAFSNANDLPGCENGAS
jgi:hypothetical protein